MKTMRFRKGERVALLSPDAKIGALKYDVVVEITDIPENVNSAIVARKLNFTYLPAQCVEDLGYRIPYEYLGEGNIIGNGSGKEILDEREKMNTPKTFDSLKFKKSNT